MVDEPEENKGQFESGDVLPLFSETKPAIVETKPVKTESIVAKDESIDGKVESVVAAPFPHMERPRKTLAQLAAEAQQQTSAGKLVCPHCGCNDFRVTNTSVVDGFRKRLRRCRHCGYPVNTIEFAMRE